MICVRESNNPEPLEIGSSLFQWGSRTYVMGIINVTPDSFAGDGVGLDRDAALRLAEQQVGEGADLIDVGGESTRPGAEPVSEEKELRRVVPAIESIARWIPVPISVDTSKAAVARAALDAGAMIVNDVWGFRHDPELPRLVAQTGAAAVLMASGRRRPYHNLMSDLVSRLEESVAVATRAGVDRRRLIVDPGLGFGTTAEQNLEIIRRLSTLKSLGLPVLVGPSRKSTIGRVLGLPVEERLEGTAALVALAIAGGADMVRVHDVQAMVRVARMTDAVVRGWTAPAGSPPSTSSGSAEH
jgi:dihydropteroate synthase